MRTLPIVAECLLQAFDIPRRNEAFVGDLVEEYGQGRSGLWLWRQTLAIIAITVFRDIRSHRLIVPCAFALGVATHLGWHAVATRLHRYMHSSTTGSEHVMWDTVSLVSMMLWRATLGWVASFVGPHATRGPLAIAYLGAMVGLDLMRLTVSLSTGARFVHPLSTHLAMLAVAWIVTIASGLLPVIRRQLRT